MNDINDLIKLAESGDASAQLDLGLCYQEGKGVEKNYEIAVEYFKKAAAQGFVFAYCFLGLCYEIGRGVKQSDEIAFEYYKKAADRGNASAQKKLGDFYQTGRGVKQSDEIAFEYYKNAADQGNVSAQKNLGYFYQKGKGVKQSDEKAVEYYKKAANQGDAIAQYKLGLVYEGGIGVEKKYEVAVEYYKKSAGQENANAQFKLGWCYLNGLGIKQNYQDAEELFKKSFANGNEKSEYFLSIFNQLNGKKIQVITDITEEVDENEVGAVLIKDDSAYNFYDIKTFKLIKTRINEILEDIEELNSNKDNEFEIFMKIYIKLGKLVSYNHEVVNKEEINKAGIDTVTSRNLVDGLLKGKSVCVGYSVILKYLLKCRGIESITLLGPKHMFNQVKIHGKWYYVDLTNDVDCINSKTSLKWCLLSKDEFMKDKSHIIINNQFTYPSEKSYYYKDENGEEYKASVYYLKKMEDQEDGSVQCNLGLCYEKGEGVEQSDERAVEYYKKAAEQGNAIAQFTVGCCYEDGEVIEQSYEKAAEYFKKAADQGDAMAQYKLGFCYEEGKVVEQSYEKAVEYYKKAADQGYVMAQHKLGLLFLDKNIKGVEPSDEKAIEYFRAAAEQGFDDAQVFLGLLYFKGRGVDENWDIGFYWVKKAMDQNNERAKEVYEKYINLKKNNKMKLIGD